MLVQLRRWPQHQRKAGKSQILKWLRYLSIQLLSSRRNPLECPSCVEMLEQVAFVGLIPTDSHCGQRPDVEAVNVRGGDEAVDE